MSLPDCCGGGRWFDLICHDPHMWGSCTPGRGCNQSSIPTAAKFTDLVRRSFITDLRHVTSDNDVENLSNRLLSVHYCLLIRYFAAEQVQIADRLEKFIELPSLRTLACNVVWVLNNVYPRCLEKKPYDYQGQSCAGVVSEGEIKDRVATFKVSLCYYVQTNNLFLGRRI